MAMSFHEFHNGIRILLNIDKWELDEAGVDLPMTGKRSWQEFRDDPWRFFICCDTPTAMKIWSIVERRQQPVRPAVSLGAIANA